MGKLFLIGVSMVIGAALIPLVGPFVIPCLALVGGLVVLSKIISNIGGK